MRVKHKKQRSIYLDLSQLPEGIMLALEITVLHMMYLEGSSLETSLQSKGSFDYPSGHMSNYPELESRN